MTVKLISPIDGSVYAERPYTTDAALDVAIARARAARAYGNGLQSQLHRGND